MARKDRTGRALETDWAAQGEKYIQRMLEDEQLRASLLSAFTAARSAYGRFGNNGKGSAHALFADPDLQGELLLAAGALRDASSALMQEPAPKPKPRRRRRRGLLLILVGAGLAIALSEGLRTKVLDLLFGAEEEFDYTSTTAPATPAPAGVAGS